MSRPLRPSVTTVVDNPIAQIKCEPDRDKIDVDAILNEVLVRFELGIGTSFDLQILSIDGKHLLAMRRYIVVKAVEEYVTANANFAQTISKTVTHRACEPISAWYVFDEVANVLHENGGGNGKDLPPDEIDLEYANPSALQAFMKEKTGKGFPPGTSREEMIKRVREYL